MPRTGCQGLSTAAERGFVRSQSRGTAGRDLRARARHCRETPGVGSRGGHGATASPVPPSHSIMATNWGTDGSWARPGEGMGVFWGHGDIERHVLAPGWAPREAAGVKRGDRGVPGTQLQGQGQGRERGWGLASPLAVDGSRWPGKAPACRGTGTLRGTTATITGPPAVASGEGCGNGCVPVGAVWGDPEPLGTILVGLGQLPRPSLIPRSSLPPASPVSPRLSCAGVTSDRPGFVPTEIPGLGHLHIPS